MPALTHEEYVKKVHDHHGDALTVIGVYVGTYVKIEHLCHKCGHKWLKLPNNIKQSGCPACGIKNSAKNRCVTAEEHIENLKEIHGDNIKCVRYAGNVKTKSDYQCLVDLSHPVWSTTPDHTINMEHGCPACGIKRSAKNRSTTLGEHIRDIKEIHGENIKCVEYSGSTQKKSTYQCLVNLNHIAWSTTPSQIISNRSGCPSCAGNLRKTFDQHIIDLKNQHGENIRCVEYGGSTHKKSMYQCLIDLTHSVWSTTPDSIIKTVIGCPTCSGNLRKTNEQHLIDLEKIHGNRITCLEFNGNTKTKSLYQCLTNPKHPDWMASPNSITSMRSGCPNCKNKNEALVAAWLIEQNINFEQHFNLHKIVQTSVKHNRLAVDFYLNDHNVVIEYDGFQHFRPTKFSYKQSNIEAECCFKKQQNRDDYVDVMLQTAGKRVIHIDGTTLYNSSLTDYFPTLLQMINSNESLPIESIRKQHLIKK
jgi:predicted  nucleic acid-binding Zn-ribbon protein